MGTRYDFQQYFMIREEDTNHTTSIIILKIGYEYRIGRGTKDLRIEMNDDKKFVLYQNDVLFMVI